MNIYCQYMMPLRIENIQKQKIKNLKCKFCDSLSLCSKLCEFIRFELTLLIISSGDGKVPLLLSLGLLTVSNITFVLTWLNYGLTCSNKYITFLYRCFCSYRLWQRDLPWLPEWGRCGFSHHLPLLTSFTYPCIHTCAYLYCLSNLLSLIKP